MEPSLRKSSSLSLIGRADEAASTKAETREVMRRAWTVHVAESEMQAPRV